MATIAITITRGVQIAPYPLTKTYTLSDANLDACIAAFQQGANTSVNGTASTAQVWLYIASQWAQLLAAQVQAANTTPAVVPAPIPIT